MHLCNFIQKTYITKIIILISIFFVSCRKEYTCSCTYQGQEVWLERGHYKKIGKWTKADAQNQCKKMENDPGRLVNPAVCEFKE